MKKASILKTFLGYIKQHFKSIMLLCIFTLIFGVVFFLYELPIESVAYATLLCASLLLVFCIFDFIMYYKRHKLLYEFQSKIIYDIASLPVKNNLLEQDYVELIKLIHSDKIRIISETDNENSERVDYYTLWVHQIKTPIAAMRLLLQEEESETNNELLTELLKIEQYVEMVLSYLRLDSSYTDFVIKEYSLDNIVKQAVRKYAPLFIRKKISLELSDLSCMVLTDEKWLLFVVEQILSNALKYTSKGTISIYMQENKTLVIEDSGIGIVQTDLPRLGEKGFTGYNGRSDKKATGIGLYLCKRILTKLSHKFVIKSEVGSYTKVEICLDTTKNSAMN